MQPLISVIIPNRSFETNESLPYIKNQTWKNIEIIEIIDKDEKGCGWARNKGAKKAKGEYLFFCDNDLQLEKDCLENLYNCLQENKWASWAFGRFDIDDGHFNFVKPITPPDDKNSKDFIEYFHGVSTMSLIRASVKPVFDEKLGRYEDWDLWIRLTRAGKLPVFCDKFLFKTQNRPHGLSMQDNSEKWVNYLYRKHLQKYADIIIPHADQHNLLAKCLEPLDRRIFNIIVVCGGTFAENCNKGAKLAETDNLIFLNDDTLPEERALTLMTKNPNDIVGCAQYIPAEQKTFYGLGHNGTWFYLADKISDVILPSGFCFKVKKSAWNELGGLDEEYRNGAEDIDLFFRAIEKEKSIGYVRLDFPHYLSKSTGRKDWATEAEKRLDKKWSKFLIKIMPRIKNREIKTEKNQEGMEYEVISECVINGERKFKGEKVALTREQRERLKTAGCVR